MSIKIIDNNKKARFNYTLLDTYEAGISLMGTEVKSLRLGKCSIKESYIHIKDGEAWLVGATIALYAQGNRYNHEEQRRRKLLLHKKEIKKIEHDIKTQRVTVVATKIYFSKGKVKLEIATGKGKKAYDKRQDAAKKSAERKIRQGDY